VRSASHARSLLPAHQPAAGSSSQASNRPGNPRIYLAGAFSNGCGAEQFRAAPTRAAADCGFPAAIGGLRRAEVAGEKELIEPSQPS